MNKSILKNWAYSNLNIATAACCYTWSTYFVYQIDSIDVALLILIFTATLSNYIFHRAFPVYYYQYTAHPNVIFQWTIEHLKFLTITFVVCLLLLGITFLKMKIATQLSLCLLALITLLYSIPIIKTSTHKKRLRDIGYLKIGLIAFTWAWVCGNLPLIQAEDSFSLTNHITVFFEKFSYIIAITIPFDIRDMQYDASVGVKTLPIRFGIVGAIIIALLCLILSYIMVMNSTTNFSVQFAYALTYCISAYYIIESAQTKNNFFYLFYIDGLMILLCILLLGALFFLS